MNPKQLSYWARDNRWKARICIAICYVLLNASASILAGIYSPGETAQLLIFFFSLSFFIAGIVRYPKKADRAFWATRFYWRQKSSDGLLILATFGLAFCFFAGSGTQLISSSALAATETSPGDSLQTNSRLSAFVASLKDREGNPVKWKEGKKLIRAQVKKIRDDEGMSAGEKTALTILCIILAIAALYGVLALSCELSCAGQEGAALLVGLGGGTLVIVLTVLAIRGIYKKGKRQQARTDSLQTDLPQMKAF